MSFPLGLLFHLNALTELLTWMFSRDSGLLLVFPFVNRYWWRMEQKLGTAFSWKSGTWSLRQESFPSPSALPYPPQHIHTHHHLCRQLVILHQKLKRPSYNGKGDSKDSRHVKSLWYRVVVGKLGPVDQIQPATCVYMSQAYLSVCCVWLFSHYKRQRQIAETEMDFTYSLGLF